MSRILLVDDERELLEIMAFALELHGHQVRSAESHAEALRALEAGEVDCLVTDYRLPGDHTGVDLIRQARSTLPNPPRAVLITGYTGAVEHQGLAEVIFHKPFDLGELVGWVDNFGKMAVAGSQ